MPNNLLMREKEKSAIESIRPHRRTGEVHCNSKGCEFVILGRTNNNKYGVKFLDETGMFRTAALKEILNGKVKNDYNPIVYGKGFFGVGSYDTYHESYPKWTRMLDRCYSNKYVAYRGCRVVPVWHNYQNFASWYVENKLGEGVALELDKDIKYIGNRTYGPDTCLLIPEEINLAVHSGGKKDELPLGVSRKGNRYVAQTSTKATGKNSRHIGSFLSPEEASQAYWAVKRVYLSNLADKYSHVMTADAEASVRGYADAYWLARKGVEHFKGVV